MWAYVVRRLLLMVPTLIGISLVNFLIINAADAPRGGAISPDGLVDASASVEAGEAERVFRSAFNLDKPVLFNTRFTLDDGEILWLVATPLRPYSTIEEKKNARDTLEDYGRGIVPHLIRLGNAADALPSELRSDYEQHWTKARKGWLKGDRPLDKNLAWPPPETPPPFDGQFGAGVLSMTLNRLYANAPRRPIVRYGEEMSEDDAAYNATVRKEQRELREVFDRSLTDPTGALAEWTKWYEADTSEWEYSFGDKASMFFLDTRFAKYWHNLLKFDLGVSFIDRRPVVDKIWEKMPISLTLSLGSLILAYIFALPLGILSGVTHGSTSDRITTVVLFALYSMPIMFVGLLLRDYFTTEWQLLPARGFRSENYEQLTSVGQIWDVVVHVTLPLIALTIGSLAYYSRFMKSGLLEVIRADFIRTARAKGLSEFVVVMRHAARNSLIPIVTLLGASLPVIIGGSVIVEVIFQIDGMGLLGYNAVLQRDYGVLLGLNIITAVLTMAGILLTDVFYAVLDPRISYK